MQITLYNFAKRQNSTARPTELINSLTVEVKLKDGTSIYNPSFLLTGNNVIDYNYLKWDDRFYWINDTTYTNSLHLIDIRCSMDVLATYKEQIQNTEAFVVYSTNMYDDTIPDTRLTMNAEADISTTGGVMFPFNDCYIVTYIGPSGAKTRRISIGSLATLSNALVTDSLIEQFAYGGTISTLLDNGAKSINSVTDCITEVHYLPVTPNTTVTETGGTIILGKAYNTGVQGYSVSHTTAAELTLNIPWPSNDFRCRSQYTSLILYLPGYGVAELNPDDFIGRTSITIEAMLDGYTGGVSYFISPNYKFSCNIASPVAIGSNTTNILNTLSSGLGVIAGFQRGALSGSMSLFNAIQSNLTRNVGSVGSNGGTNDYTIYQNVILATINHGTNIPPENVANIMGRPLNQNITLSQCTGYVQTVDASVSVNAPESIISEINNYLNGGVFIE